MHRNCAKPLFIQDPWLLQGHNKKTVNATVTFLRYDGSFYAITCTHVLSAVSAGQTLMIAKGRSFIKLATAPGQYIHGNAHEFRPVPAIHEDAPDIAIFPMVSVSEEWFSTVAEVTPHELRDVNTWPNQTLCEAFGYATNHKIEDRGLLSTPGLSVVATLDEPSDKHTFWISSVVKDGYRGYDVSGMSGGPVFCSYGDEQIVFGIVKGSLRPRQGSPQDVIAIECERLSTSRFDGWLERI